jgi:uncharacterized damage-inducible protein DinB
MHLDDLKSEFSRYRVIAEKAMEQASESCLNFVPGKDANSIGMIVRHLNGNFLSRFTDILTSDGEKPWRDREGEFVERNYSRAEIKELWTKGWTVVESTLNSLKESDLDKTITIRQQPHTVHEALARLSAHTAYHVGQVVTLARMEAGDKWKSMSIPRGK